MEEEKKSTGILEVVYNATGQDSNQQLGTLGVISSILYMVFFDFFGGLLGLVPSAALRLPEETKALLDVPKQLGVGLKREYKSLVDGMPATVPAPITIKEKAKVVMVKMPSADLSIDKLKARMDMAALNKEADELQEDDNLFLLVQEILASKAK